MANLYVTEMAASGAQRVTEAQVGKLKGCVQNPVSFTGTPNRSAAFAAATKLIRVVADTACAVKVGASDVAAAATDTRLAAGAVEYFDVDGGDYISAITT